MIPNRVVVVDDEPAIRRLLKGVIERHGCAAFEAADARAALSLVAIERPDVVLLDLGLPDRDGMELVPLLAKDAVVIVISARDNTDEKIAALDLGADDFITKPFDGEELMARLRSALRRRSGGASPARVEAGDLIIDLEYRRVTRNGCEVHLTPKEYALLAELATHSGKVLTHLHLLRSIWGPAHERDLQYLRVAIRGLRQKVEPDPSSPRLIVNEPGIGYRFLGGSTPA